MKIFALYISLFYLFYGCKENSTQPVQSATILDTVKWYPSQLCWGAYAWELPNGVEGLPPTGLIGRELPNVENGDTLYPGATGFNLILHVKMPTLIGFSYIIAAGYNGDKIIFHNTTATKGKIFYTISFNPVDSIGSHYLCLFDTFVNNLNAGDDFYPDPWKKMFVSSNIELDIPQEYLCRNLNSDTSLSNYSMNPNDLFIKGLMFYFCPFVGSGNQMPPYSGTISISNIRIEVY